MTKTVVGLYNDSATAERAVRALVDNGFAREDISLVAQDATHGNQPPMPAEPAVQADTVADGTAAGAGTGAVIGGVAGLFAGLGALAIPGLGPLIAAGPLAAVLAGAGTGAIAGGLIGALVDAGISAEQAQAYAEGVRRGGMLVMLRAPDDWAADAVRMMDQFGAIDMEQRAREWREQNPNNQPVHNVPRQVNTEPTPPASRLEIGEQTAMPDSEANATAPQPAGSGTATGNEMAVGPAAPRSGASSDADQAPAAHEQQREPMQTQTAAGEDPDFSGVGHGDWESRDVGAIIAHDAASDDVAKTEDAGPDRAMAQGHSGIQDQGQLVNPDMARNPQAQLEDVAGADVSGSSGMNNQDWRSRELGAGGAPGPGGEGAWQSGTSTGAIKDSYETFADDFRRHHEMVFGASGRSYAQQESGYRFGYDLARDPDYQGRKWTEIEPNAQRAWQRQQPQLAWDEYRAAIRHGWERVTRSASYQSGSNLPDASATDRPTTGGVGDTDQIADRG